MPLKAPSFMDGLPPSLARKITNAAIPVAYKNGALVHNRGDTKPGLSIVKSGAVNVGIYDVEGIFVMASVLGPGQTFGEFTLFAGLPRTHDITASGDTVIYQLPGQRFPRLCDEEPAIGRALLSSTLLRTHMLLEIMDAMRRLPLRERVAKILLLMLANVEDTPAFKCRQSDLAYTLGISRMSLSKALRSLGAEGLIDTGYGAIIVPDRVQLAKWVTQHCHASQ